MIANPNDGNSPRVEVATPMIDVSAGGLITATTEQEKGYVSGGTKSATQQLTTQGAATITPTTTNQTAVASGRYTTGDVKVAGDANLVPENIAEGVSIFGVAGTHSGGGGVGEWVTIPLSESLSRAGGNTRTVYGTLSVSQVPFVVYFLMCKTGDGSPFAGDTVFVSEITENSAGRINNQATSGRFGISQLDIANNLWSITFFIDTGFGTYSSKKCYALVIYNPTI